MNVPTRVRRAASTRTTPRCVCLGVLAALLLSACGPLEPVRTDVKPAGQDVFFGVPTPVPQPTPQLIQFNPVQTFPTVVEQPPAITVAPAPTPNPCPDLSPLAVPAAEATVLATHPPAAGTYPFRHQGTITTGQGTSSQKVVTLPQDGMRQITNVSALGLAGDYSFDVVDTYNKVTTTTSYHVYPQGTVPAGPLTGVAPGVSNSDAGVYITAITTMGKGQAQPESFTPVAPGVEIFPFPATAGGTWTGTGTDPTTGTTMVVGPTASSPQGTGQVVDRQRVNACGTALDAWQATMQGTIEAAPSGPNSSNTFTLTIDMAPQFGGLILSDFYTETYNDLNNGGVNTVYSVGATINVVPSAPPA